jgi:hypothetical protein
LRVLGGPYSNTYAETYADAETTAHALPSADAVAGKADSG